MSKLPMVEVVLVHQILIHEPKGNRTRANKVIQIQVTKKKRMTTRSKEKQNVVKSLIVTSPIKVTKHKVSIQKLKKKMTMKVQMDTENPNLKVTIIITINVIVKRESRNMTQRKITDEELVIVVKT